jgi:hypothetical protein
MGESDREFSGREFSAEDISIIKETTRMYPKLSQKELASTVCELISWQTPGGQPKRVQCVEFLRKLEQEGIITLPAIKTEKRRQGTRNTAGITGSEPVVTMPEDNLITSCGEIQLQLVRPGDAMQRWRENISKYHYLGDTTVRGSQIRYNITSEGRDLGCLLFSASSWSLSPREEWIGWTVKDRKARLHLVINNSRFLLLPYVRVQNLASRVLSMASRQIQDDWLTEYFYTPVLLETFVDTERYQGTIYRASNWICLGETQGRGRNDRRHEGLLSKKAIYALPLRRDFRAVLKGEKPCRAVNPDEA